MPDVSYRRHNSEYRTLLSEEDNIRDKNQNGEDVEE